MQVAVQNLADVRTFLENLIAKNTDYNSKALRQLSELDATKAEFAQIFQLIALNNFEKSYTESMIPKLLELQARCEENVKLLQDTDWASVEDVEEMTKKMHTLIPGAEAVKEEERALARLTQKVDDLET